MLWGCGPRQEPAEERPSKTRRGQTAPEQATPSADYPEIPRTITIPGVPEVPDRVKGPSPPIEEKSEDKTQKTP